MVSFIHKQKKSSVRSWVILSFISIFLFIIFFVFFVIKYGKFYKSGDNNIIINNTFIPLEKELVLEKENIEENDLIVESEPVFTVPAIPVPQKDTKTNEIAIKIEDEPSKEVIDTGLSENITTDQINVETEIKINITTDTNYDNQLLALINVHRVENGLGELTEEPGLHELAAEHSSYMKEAGKLSHDSFSYRFAHSGHTLCVENVGWNYETASGQLGGWKSSNAHNLNLLKEGIRTTGIAKVGAYVTFFACN